MGFARSKRHSTAALAFLGPLTALGEEAHAARRAEGRETNKGVRMEFSKGSHHTEFGDSTEP